MEICGHSLRFAFSCTIKDGGQSSFSCFARITAVAVAVLALVVGILILCGVSSFHSLGSGAGGGFVALGILLLAIGSLFRCSPIMKSNKEVPQPKKQEEKKQETPKEETVPVSHVKPDVVVNKRAVPLSLCKQVQNAAMEFHSQKMKLSNAAAILEEIKRKVASLTVEQLNHYCDEEKSSAIDLWLKGVISYLDDRWAWVGSSGRYSLIRQLITDPALNQPLQDPTFLLALLCRAGLNQPVLISELDVGE